MSGGAYVALSGLRVREAQLDRVAADIANAGTAGYKAERSSSHSAERPNFSLALESAVDVAEGSTRIDFRPGTLAPTGRDLDFAIDGPGFFVVDTPVGPRYTRCGSFSVNPEGVLVTADGAAVQGTDGAIHIGAGEVTADPDGTIRVGGAPAGKVRIVDFDNPEVLARESAGRFRAPSSVTPHEGKGALHGGALEQANVSIVERVAHLTELTRSFEALNRGISVLMNDLDGRAISELGRR
jgi:flagellar basal-body rod protein FlgF